MGKLVDDQGRTGFAGIGFASESHGSTLARVGVGPRKRMATDNGDQQASNEPPADIMSPRKRKQLQQCFERANEATKKPDHDYAHELYMQAVVNDPGNMVYVEAMLTNLQKKFKNNKKGSRFNFGGGRKAFKEAVADEDWNEIFREGLELLKSNPWDTQVLRELARACAFNRYNEVELRYLKNALDGKPKDVEVNRHCAQSLARNGQFDMAISCWSRVAEKTKGDEAEKMIAELTLAKTMRKPASLEAIGASGDRPMSPMPMTSTDAEERDPLETPRREAPKSEGQSEGQADEDSSAFDVDDESDENPTDESLLNQRQKLEKKIRENPTDADAYFQLADLLTNDGRYADAEKTLASAIAACGASLKLESLHEDAQIRTSKAKVAIADQRYASSKSDEAKELATKLRSDLNRLELEIYQKRCQRYPERLRLHYDLALRLRRAGNYLEAIKAYDAARKEETCKVAATLEMGECWQQLKQYSKAMKCYEAAISASSDLDGDRQKMALYRGGILAAALKKSGSGERVVRPTGCNRSQLQRCRRPARQTRLDSRNYWIPERLPFTSNNQLPKCLTTPVLVNAIVKTKYFVFAIDLSSPPFARRSRKCVRP